jgi:signal transduction histidine kinase
LDGISRLFNPNNRRKNQPENMTDNFGEYSPHSWRLRLTVSLILLLILTWGGVTIVGYDSMQQLEGLRAVNSLSIPAQQRFLAVSFFAFSVNFVLTFVLAQRSLSPLEKIIQQTHLNLERQKQLINDLSHELRSPLTMIYSYLQRLQKQSQGLNPSQQESLAMAVADAERMTQLLEGWLNLARSEVQRLVTLNLNEILLETAITVEKLTDRAINVQLPQRAILVSADRSRLMQVFDHLLDNAVYYSQEPVTVTLKVVRKRAVVEVSDRGCGIPPEKLERIFDPLYRVDSSRSRTTGGFGLGLPYVKRSLESCGGSIEVRSRRDPQSGTSVGAGSCFIVKLPLAGVRR